MLESTVQKYRAELASASSNITGKDILISKLDDQVGTRSHIYMYKLPQLCVQALRALGHTMGASISSLTLLTTGICFPSYRLSPYINS